MKKRNLIMVMVFGMMFLCTCKNQWIGKPDCIGNIRVDNDYMLQIVANRYKIKDEEEFAWELFDMCRENSYRSILFSYDLEGYPNDLIMDIYWNEKDIEPFMEIQFVSKEGLEECDITDGRENYMLFINGKRIE